VVALTTTGRRLLARTGRIRVAITVQFAVGSDHPVSVTRTRTITAPPFRGVTVTGDGRVDGAGRSHVRVTCPTTSIGSCTGTLDLLRSVQGRRVRIARSSFIVGRGRTSTVGLELTAFSAEQVRSAPRGVAVTLVASARDSRAGTRSSRRALVLRDR
jgi:hypothetical protein